MSHGDRNNQTDEITPYENNAKEHNDEQVTHIINSIRSFGMCDPIGVWGESNIIVEGHGRYLALKQMGYDSVPCIRLDHLSDEERRAYTHVHNHLTLETLLNQTVLAAEIADIPKIDMTNLALTLIPKSIIHILKICWTTTSPMWSGACFL